MFVVIILVLRSAPRKVGLHEGLEMPNLSPLAPAYVGEFKKLVWNDFVCEILYPCVRQCTQHSFWVSGVFRSYV